MQGQMEVEEILDQKLWEDRNGLDQEPGAYMPSAKMLREHELKTYRDCPLEYESRDDPMSGGYWVLAILMVAATVAAVVWNWPRH